ncbi:MAG: glycerol-3-phosphate acyltransferase [Lachnospiraceae bacterium]|nr:glycerol-3-phosphate acyltransferase [Lachnospiraceae bacterium]
MNYFFWITAGYLSGSIMYAYLLPMLIKHIDIRSLSDDGNPGTANAFKHAGVSVGICVICCELLKGFFPVWLACRRLNMEKMIFALVMASPVLGHAYPLFWKGRNGGKSIAVSFGVLLGFLPDLRLALLLAAYYLLFSLIVIIRPHLLRSVLTYLCYCVSCLLLGSRTSIVAGCLLISAIVIWKHLVKYKGEKISISFLRPQKARPDGLAE